jgi:hypothetical protein
MTVTLNRAAFEYAKGLIAEGRFVFDDRDAWSEHRPSAQKENSLHRAARVYGICEMVLRHQ